MIRHPFGETVIVHPYLPEADRDAYLAERMPTKALLTMRLHPGTEAETWVDNPLHRRRRRP